MRDYSRREFHALVLAGAAAGLAKGCGSSADGSVALSNGKVVLSFNQFPQLRSSGGSVVVDVPGSFPIAVVRTTDARAVALSATCTHQGCLLRFQGARQDLYCDCHRANFSLNGAVINGPTTIPLPTYIASVDVDAITVQIIG